MLVALALAQATRDTDLDKEDRLNEASKDAQRAIDNIDTGMAVPPNTPPEKVQSAKNSILEMAYETEGTVAMTKKDSPAAEAAFRKGLEVNPASRMASFICDSPSRSITRKSIPRRWKPRRMRSSTTRPGSEAQNLATQEKTRLQKLTGSSTSGSDAAPTAQ